MKASYWTLADSAELEVLVYELARGREHHRANCRACQPGECADLAAWRAHRKSCAACRGDAPLTHGPPCEHHTQFVAHGDDCPRCNPCPGMQRAIAIVGEWREARILASKAAWLRQREDENAAA